jgi:hypothetical protein
MASTPTDSVPVGNPQAAGIIYVQGVPTPETRLTLGGAISVSPMAIGTWAWGVSKRKNFPQTDQSSCARARI